MPPRRKRPRPNPHCNYDNLETGKWVACITYEKIEKKDTNFLGVKPRDSPAYDVARNIVNNTYFSADHFEQEEKVSKTDLVEIMRSAGPQIMQIRFEKKVQPKSAAETLKTIADTDLQSFKSDSKLKEIGKMVTTGPNRVVVGHLMPNDDARSVLAFGRSMVFDLEKGRPVQVDHRTLQWVILRNVKYVAK